MPEHDLPSWADTVVATFFPLKKSPVTTKDKEDIAEPPELLTV